jgi:hypothetical protein
MFYLSVKVAIHVDGLSLRLNCGHQRAYCSSPKWHKRMEPSLNDSCRIKPKNSERNFPNAISFTTHPTWADLDANPGRRGERLATSRLSHGTTNVTVNNVIKSLKT